MADSPENTALSADEYVDRLYSRQAALVKKLDAIDDALFDGVYDEPGSIPNASGKDSVDHDGYYKRLQDALERVNAEIEKHESDQPFYEERRGVA